MGKGFYRFAWGLCRAFYSVFYPRKIEGLENVPKDGGCLLCINHLSFRDPIYVATALPAGRGLGFMAKKELFGSKLAGKLLSSFGAIPVDRGNADIGAVRASFAAIKEGKAFFIFPQGTRSRDNSPTPMLTGSAMIAQRASVPVVPVYIGGPYRLFRRTPLRFGKPLDLSGFGRKSDSETLKAVTGMISDGIWSMR